MKNNKLYLLLAGVGISVLSAVVSATLVLRQSSPVSRGTSPQAIVPSATGVDELHAEVSALRTENAGLRTRLSALELRVPTTERAPVGAYVPLADFLALQAQVSAALGEPGASSIQGGVLKAQVADALDAVREDEAQVRARRLLEDQAARLEKNVVKLTERLGLNEYQATEMRALLAQKDERDSELVRRWKAGEDQAVLGEVKRVNAAAHRTELERVLTPEQLQILSSRSRDKD